VQVKLRSASAPAWATVEAHGAGKVGAGAVLRLDQPQHGVAPGQAGVIYDGSRVLGGGWIERAALSAEAERSADPGPGALDRPRAFAL
jgi:tRNA-uridine 2-sulfurtransferase